METCKRSHKVSETKFSLAEGIRTWAERNGCNYTASNTTTFTNYSGSDFPVHCESISCPYDMNVTLCTGKNLLFDFPHKKKVEGGNHQWPSGYDDPSPPHNIFAGTSNLNATQQIWEFFKMFPRPPITSGQTVVTTLIAPITSGVQNAGTSSSSSTPEVSTSSSTTEAEASNAPKFASSLFVMLMTLLYM